MISATGQAKVVRSVNDIQASLESAENVFVCGWSAWTEAIWMEAKWMDGGKTATDESDNATGCRRPCYIYCVTSSSECEGSCLGVRDICPELG